MNLLEMAFFLFLSDMLNFTKKVLYKEINLKENFN